MQFSTGNETSVAGTTASTKVNSTSWKAQIFASLIMACAASVANAGDAWTNWRGPSLNGNVSPGKYPVQWDESTNIAWSTPLPGRSSSTPIVYEDKIVLTLPIEEENGVMAFDRAGKELWRVKLGKERPGKHKKASGSNPSPVTDGKRIFVYFKSGDFAALDWSGKVLWHKNLQKEFGEDTLWWDLGTSPVLTSKHIVVACMQSGPSYLAAFDPETGNLAWKVDRILSAPDESAQSYTTPVVTNYKGQEQIVVLGADHVTCHAASDGKELWRVGTLNPDQERYFRSIASPVIVGDVVIAPYARGKTLTAIRLGGNGDVTESHVLWKKDIGSDVPTPAAFEDKVLVASDKGVITCLNSQTGEELWSETLEKNRNNYSSSPVISGNMLYYTREDGKTFVVDLNDKSVKGTNPLGNDDTTYATPVLVDNEILLRTGANLYSIRNAK
ncbi:outer membrane protein assembly factor BamB family protein [Planctomicrobium sp. SH527]|uniref:outer membrane protein assembly factor BamB family protein n=1 Tax=Planctomicrobium sp. SH527 TaxID=3448123 RepID=UPI003F5C9C1F